MKWKPRLYQLRAFLFMMTRNKGALFLDPGLGKTSITLLFLRIIILSGKSNGALIIAPLRVCQLVWPLEILKWANFNILNTVFLHGDNKAQLWGEKRHIYLINPEGIGWLYDELAAGLNAGKKCPFNTLIVDESTKFKNPTSKTLFLLLKDMLGLFSRRYILTGTPSPKNLMDLWSQIYIVDRGEALGDNFYKFRKRYFHNPSYCNKIWELNEGAESEIQNKISHLCLDMRAAEHLSMPPVIFNNIFVTMSRGAEEKYKAMETKLFTELEGGSTATAAAVAPSLMKCQQLANGVIYEDIDPEIKLTQDKDLIAAAMKTRKAVETHTEKLKALQNLVDELQGKPLLIAYRFKHDLIALRKQFGNIPHIGSGVSEKETIRIVSDWNAGLIPILAGHPVSMGHGLNMQASGNDIAWYGLPFSLEEYLQFNARIYRQGVRGSVRIHHILTKNTIDESALILLSKKEENQTNLRDAIAAYRSRL